MPSAARHGERHARPGQRQRQQEQRVPADDAPRHVAPLHDGARTVREQLDDTVQRNGSGRLENQQHHRQQHAAASQADHRRQHGGRKRHAAEQNDGHRIAASTRPGGPVPEVSALTSTFVSSTTRTGFRHRLVGEGLSRFRREASQSAAVGGRGVLPARPTPTARRLAEVSLSPNTRRAYAGAIRRLEQRMRASPPTSPSSTTRRELRVSASTRGGTRAGERTARVLVGYWRTATDRGPPRLTAVQALDEKVPSDHDAFDLVDRHPVRRPVVELRRLGRRVPGDLLGVLQGPPVRQIRRDPRRPERVTTR